MGLEWQDINFKDNTLTVRQASQYLPNQGIFTKDPKTESSKRIIALPGTECSMLLSHKSEQETHSKLIGPDWVESIRIFTQNNGNPMHPDTITQWFSDFIKKHDLPNITFHGLRHTNASLLIAQGMNLKTVSTRLGHTNISTTLDIYTHALRKADVEAADKFEEIIKQKDNKENHLPSE